MDAARGGPQEIPRPPRARQGGPPPWAHLIDTDPALRLADVRRAFDDLSVDRSITAMLPDIRRSAVAVIVSERGELDASGDVGGGLELLLTRRAWGMRTHRGEVAFPGGAEDPGDEFPIGTALREATEEVGLDRDTVEVIGALDPLTTFTSDRVVIPVVGMTMRRPAMEASPVEVDAVLHVPLAELLHPDCYHEERWSWGEDFEFRSAADHPMHFFDLHGDTIWGATAAMVHQLLTVVLVGR